MDWLIHIQNWLLSWSVVAMVGSFGGGILASFTPCTYPVLPIVISYLGYQSGKKRPESFCSCVSLCYWAGSHLWNTWSRGGTVWESLRLLGGE